MQLFLIFIEKLVGIYIWIIITGVVLSWLIAFDIINIRNRYVYAFVAAINGLTEPLYRPVRRFVPPISGLDLSPVIVIFALFILVRLLQEIFLPY